MPIHIEENDLVCASSVLVAMAKYHGLHQRALLPRFRYRPLIHRLFLCCDDSIRCTQAALGASKDSRAPGPFILPVSVVLYKEK